jgi:hypothetical protein
VLISNHQQEDNMTNTEMNKRLASIPLNTLCRAIQCISEGYGGQGTKIETGLTLAQVNAVFEWRERR